MEVLINITRRKNADGIGPGLLTSTFSSCHHDPPMGYLKNPPGHLSLYFPCYFTIGPSQK